MPGDVSLPGAGLAPDTYDAVANGVDAIIHSAARVHWLAPFEELAGPNVDGTRRMLELAARGRPKTMHHVSSIGVFPYRPDVPVFEDSDIDHDEPLFGGYVQTKWVAEKLVERAGELGVPVRTYRPGTLDRLQPHGALQPCVLPRPAPDRQRPARQLPDPRARDRDDAGRLLRGGDRGAGAGSGCRQRGLPPHESRAGAGRAPSRPDRGAGYETDRQPFESWRDRLLASPGFEQNALYPFRLFLAAVQADQLSPPPYGSERAQAALAAAGVACPPVDEALIATYFARYRAEGFL